ncbi:DUF4157 domain-containing protein [Amycolatopsis sp. NEAU-NG30]|uniref:DUF4157 domain-containing protein n=1 Tax=Amycolatopsis melonis TaxID=3156488 RepID=A0ABV0LMF9_9PSEU
MDHHEPPAKKPPRRPKAAKPSRVPEPESPLFGPSTPDTVTRLQRAAGNSAVTSALQRSQLLPSGTGRPLERGTRREMETALGADFGDVRIHQGADADRAAKDVGAAAFTVGSDIVFSGDRYSPGTSAGRELLAHELTHVRQQRLGPVSGTDRGDGVLVSDPADHEEQEAARTGAAVAAGSVAAVGSSGVAARTGATPVTGSPSVAARTGAAAGSVATPVSGSLGVAGRPVVQTVPTVTKVVAPAAVGVGKSVTVTATAAGTGKLTWTLTGAPAGVTIAPLTARTARITATAGSVAGAGANFTVKAALAATPADNAVSGAVALAGVTKLAFTPVPAFPAIPAPMSATGPVDTGEPNRDGVTGNTVTVTATTAPAGRPVTVTLPAPAGHAVAGTTITPGATTGKLVVRATDTGTGASLDKAMFVNPVPKKVISVGPPQTFPGAPYGSINMIKFSASDSASPLTRGVGETITAGGVDDLQLVPIVNGGPNPNPKLPTTVSASFWNDQNTTPAANAIVKSLVDVNKFVGPGVAKPLPAVTKFRQGFHWLSWTGVPNYSAEFDTGFHRRSLVKAGAGFQFVTEQVFPGGSAAPKKDAYAGNPLINFTAVTVAPKAPAAAALAADGVATADVTMTSSVAGRSVNWFLVSGPMMFTGAAAGLPLATPVNVQGGTVAGPAKLRGEDTVFPNRQFVGTVPLAAVTVSALAGGSAKVPAGALTNTFTFTAQPGGRTITPTVDAASAAKGVTAAVAVPGPAAAAPRTVTVTRPAGFTGVVTVTVTDSVLAAKTAKRTFRFL